MRCYVCSLLTKNDLSANKSLSNMQAPHPASIKTTLAHFEAAPRMSVDDSIQSK